MLACMVSAEGDFGNDPGRLAVKLIAQVNILNNPVIDHRFGCTGHDDRTVMHDIGPVNNVERIADNYDP